MGIFGAEQAIIVAAKTAHHAPRIFSLLNEPRERLVETLPRMS